MQAHEMAMGVCERVERIALLATMRTVDAGGGV
jgi:hypothetical protein